MKYRVKGLTCANCAMKIEEDVKALPGVEATQVNVWKELLEVKGHITDEEELFQTISQIVKGREPGVEVSRMLSPKEELAHRQEEGHDHDHDHGHSHNHDESPIKWGWFIGGLALFALSFLVQGTLNWILFLAGFVAVAYPVLLEAVEKLGRGDPLDESFLMTVASIGAIAIGQRTEGLAVMTLYLVGEYLEFRAVGRARHSLQALMDYQPEEARVWQAGQWVVQPAGTVEVGMLVQVLPGEKLPADGVVERGQSFVDTAHLTGESVPQAKGEGDPVLAGSIAQDGVLEVRVTEDYDHSAVAKMLQLIEEAGDRKADSERFVTRFARVFTPIVLALALVIAVGVPLVTGEPWMKWIYRALTFLVISCPCALVLSIPLAYFAGIGAASKEGVLVKGSQYVDDLAAIDTIVFDKTGTLTTGQFQVIEVHAAADADADELLALAAQGEQNSTHPLALAVLKAYEGPLHSVENVENLPGLGLRFDLDGDHIALGNDGLMQSLGLTVPDTKEGAIIHLAKNEVYLGYLRLEDRLKSDAKEAVQYYRQQGIQTVLLSGDQPAVVQRVGETLGIDTIRGGLLPEQKHQWIEETMEQGHKVAYVGDGINDGPAMAQSTVGLAMGSLASASTIQVADVVIMRDEMETVAKSHRLAQRIVGVVRFNVGFILGIKALFLILGALGLANIWMAVFADVGVAVLSVLNAVRLMGNIR